jgi:hypothetical protein
MVDQQNRLRMADLLRRICDEESTGWQVHDEAEKIDSADESIESVFCILDILYGGWETTVRSLDLETRQILERCRLFLSTDMPLRITAEHFRTKRKYWFDKFDSEGFLAKINDGIWPFETKEKLVETNNRGGKEDVI